MALMLDASVIIAGEKGRLDIKQLMARHPDEQLELAAITIAELWHGVERATSAHRTGREQYLRSIISALPVIPYTEATAYIHARIWAELKTAGGMSGFYDVILAAAALERGNTVVTFNTKHFAQIKGLAVIDPRQP